MMRLSGSSSRQNGYKVKSMNFPDRLGERRPHSRSYGNDEQYRQAGKGTISRQCFGETDYQGLFWSALGLAQPNPDLLTT